MHYLIEILCVVAELFFIAIFSYSLFEPKGVSVRAQIALYALFGAVLLVLSFIADAAVLRILYTLVGVCGLIRFCCEARFLQALLASFAFCALYTLTDLLVLGVFSVTGLDSQKIILFGTSRSVYLIATHIVLLGLIVLTAVISRRHYGIVSLRILLPFLPCWVVSILLCCLLVVDVYRTNTDLHPLYAVVAAGLLVTNIVIIVFTSMIQKHEQAQREAELSEHHYTMQKAYYEQFAAQQEEVHAIWHDINKYLRALKAENGDVETSPSWKQIQTTLNSVTELVDVGNPVLNVILNEYFALAKAAQAKLNLNVQVPGELAVTAVDLYVIIGNTLDNALAACRKLPQEERVIDLVLKTHNEILYYQVINSFEARNAEEKEKKPSARYEKHGYGLPNIQKSVKKYNGSVEITKEAGKYKVCVVLNLL